MTTNRDFELPPRREPREPRTGRDALPWLATVMLALAVAAAVGYWLYRQQMRSEQIARVRRNLAEVAAQVGKHQAERAVDKAKIAAQLAAADELRAAVEQIVDDPAGRLLWASPTHGAPVSLAYAPGGALCFVYVRPAQLLAHGEGEKVMAALGPWGREMADVLESFSGFKLAEIDAVLASIVVRSDGELDVCFRFELVRESPFYQQHRLEAGGETGRRLDLPGWPDRARFWVMRDEVGQSRTLVVCPEEFYFALAGSEGAPPLVARDLEALVAQSDGDRVATVIVSPKFLAAAGARLVTGEAEPIRTALDRLAGDEATALALSAHWSNDFFVELRAAPALSLSPRWLATVLSQRLQAAVPEIDALLARQSWSEYAEQVVARFPEMVRSLAEHARSGQDDRQAVVRAYLPAVAGHNLLMGAELLLTQAGGAGAGDDALAGAGDGPAREDGLADGLPQSIDQRLAAPVTLVFPRETLGRALELLAAELGAEVTIDFAALEAEGITQNQTLQLDLRGRSAGEALVEILRQANPDRTAPNAADPRQKLVYFVESAPGARGRIIVTTRAAAEAAGRRLPSVFAGAGG